MTLSSSGVAAEHATPLPNEHEPLLGKRTATPNPLPKLQLGVIYAIKLTLPIALTQALPYYNVFIGRLASSVGADTGYYSGLAV